MSNISRLNSYLRVLVSEIAGKMCILRITENKKRQEKSNGASKQSDACMLPAYDKTDYCLLAELSTTKFQDI